MNLTTKQKRAIYYQENKEKIKEKVRLYRENNKEKHYNKTREYIKTHPEENKKHKKDWMIRNPLYVLFSNCRARAKKEGYPFNLDFEYLKTLPRPEFCPVLGIPIDNSTIEHKLSLDKLHPEKGYTKGNVFFISMKANRMKQDSSLQQLELLVKYIKDNS